MFDQQEPVDIFSDTDKSTAQRPVPPLAPGATGSPVLPPSAYASAERRGPPRIVFVLVAVVVLGGIGAGGYYFLNQRTPAPATNVPENTAPTTNIALNQEPTTNEPPVNALPEPVNEPATNVPTNEPVNEPEPAPEPLPDADGDGLSDEEETRIGTNPQATDSDADGLSDREEVEIYRTNPLNPDTDGDTFLDGQEVKGGYDPNGPGRLFEVPQP